jgi:CIC family chloride channel protein
MARARRAATRLARRVAREPSAVLAVAAVIGVGTGLVVIAFYRVIDVVQRLVLEGALAALPAAVFIPVAVAGGLVVCRALVRWGARGSDGENIPDVMHAIAARGGRVRPRPVVMKTLAAAVVIGTGGSVGPEGPVVVAGAAAGSAIGRWFNASSERLKTLVGAGAAAGIAAAFNAPIAGVLFAVEKMLGSFGAASFAPVVVAAVLASVVGRTAFGDDPVIRVPTEFGVGAAPEMLLYALLGVLAGLLAAFYTRAVHDTHARFARLKPWLAVAVGTLIVGALNLAFRADLWGRGHESLDLAIVADRTAWFLGALALAKLVATSASLAVGGVGGVFTPALFIGATLGGAVGVGAGQLLPQWGLAPQAFALVGMAGLVAGSTHAPLTAMMMVFEMTGDYGLILPLMLCSAIAFLVARRVHPESIYTEWLARRGIHLTHGADAALLARLSVAECYNREPVLLAEGATLPDVLGALRGGRQTEFPVVDDERRLVGVVTALDIRDVLGREEHLGGLLVAGDLARPDGDVLEPHDSLLTALRRFGARDATLLPVVDARATRRVIGALFRADLFAAYERGLAEQAH